MLFVNGRRQIRSVTDRYIPVPFVRERFRHDLARVRAFFVAYPHDFAFIQAPVPELERCLGAIPTALRYPSGLIHAGEWAIANELIGVASALPDIVAVTFDSEHPSEPHRFDAVVFASATIAVAFLASILKTAENRSAFAAALDHRAGQRYANIAPAEETGELAMRLPDAAAGLARRAAPLLVSQYLALLPRDPWQQQLRLAWIEHMVPASVTAGSSAPARLPQSPPPAPPPPPSVSAPMSVLPDPPAGQTLQAQTLIKAAKNGTPFCEECARRAAELAGV